MQVKKDIMWRINGSFIIMCLMGFLILGQILKIQIAEGDKWRQLADSSTLHYFNIAASRGNIFSSDGSLMATSVPIYDIRLDTRASGLSDEAFHASIDSLGICLSRLFQDHSAAEYKQIIRNARAQNERYFLLRRNVTYTELQQLKTFPLFRLGRYKGGFRIEQKEMRELPFRMLASRTIGYLRDVNNVGIESSFNDELKGAGGKRLMQKISGNVWMPVTDKDVLEPKDGYDLVTTIDINIQDVAENSLEQHLRMQNADHGCAVLMEVATGEIKAIANLSRTAEGNYIENFNYVIGEATEPGSTMKMASLLAAIDDTLASPGDTVVVNNGIHYFYGQKMEDSHPPRASKITLQQAFETSSNVGVSKEIWKCYVKNPQAYVDKLRSFGFGKPLGLQIEGEGIPQLKNTTDKKSWSSVSLPWISIGYETTITPLQMLTFYNAIANNGRMVKPFFVKEIRSHGQLVKSYPTEILRDSIASPASLAIARKMMEGVVERGTASSLKTSLYRIAGKTGTAQIARNKFGYDKEHPSYQASFVGYFPADAPKYSCMVVVYSPSKDIFGGAVAAPIFKEIADKVYSNRLELHGKPAETDTNEVHLPLAKAGEQKELKKILATLNIPVKSKTDDALNVSSNFGTDQLVLNERKTQNGIVPDVTGMGTKDAIYILENAGLRVQCSGRGIVTRQSPAPGMRIVKGQTVSIDLNY